MRNYQRQYDGKRCTDDYDPKDGLVCLLSNIQVMRNDPGKPRLIYALYSTSQRRLIDGTDSLGVSIQFLQTAIFLT